MLTILRSPVARIPAGGFALGLARLVLGLALAPADTTPAPLPVSLADGHQVALDFSALAGVLEVKAARLLTTETIPHAGFGTRAMIAIEYAYRTPGEAPLFLGGEGVVPSLFWRDQTEGTLRVTLERAGGVVRVVAVRP